jgi:FlaA1/EpsC-like NDP-sugar epimerase
MMMFETIKRLSLADSSPVLNLSRIKKRIIVLVVDLCLCILSVWFAYYLKLGEFISPTGQNEWVIGSIWASVISIIFALPIFIALGLYRAIFRYSGWPALMAVARAISIYGLLYVSIFTVIGFPGVPRTVGIIQPILLLFFIGASRAFARVWLGDQYIGILKKSSCPKVLIYGAGSSGRQLVAALANSQDIQVVGFLDDNVDLQQHTLNGQKVYSPLDLINLVSSLSISQIYFSRATLPRNEYH